MKQILQDLRTGETSLLEVPPPHVGPGQLLIRTSASLVSAGTERMLLEFGKASLLSKARQQPDKVRQVIDKVRTDGIAPTLKAVQAKLDKPIPLGYSNAGRVVAVGTGVTRFAVGDRVVSNGSHAEFVCVGENLCAHIPDNVGDEEASITVLAAIGLQGIRLVQPTLGELVVVTGLGLIGLLTVQLLRANGCRVLGIDPDGERTALARKLGADVCQLALGEDPLQSALRFSNGRGVDAVLITATTSSNEPMHQAAQMCRKRGRIVLVGVVGLELSRADFYEKELTFQVSCSYGPGRYDAMYEQQGNDYPLGYVRWTEQRNFEAVLALMASGQLDVKELISHRFDFFDALHAYAALVGEKSLGMILRYPGGTEPVGKSDRVSLGSHRDSKARGNVRIGMIGAGSYAAQVLIPALKETGAHLRTLVSEGGVSSVYAGKKFGFEQAASDPAAVFDDVNVDAVVIATRHDSHAEYACRALAQGKHVFVEKPLAVTPAEFEQVMASARASGKEGLSPLLMVGFNRRFAPQVTRIKSLLETRPEPKCMVMTVNAGAIPSEHWTQDLALGGGRILGEACHFIDLLRHLAGSPIKRTLAMRIGAAPGVGIRDDKATITLEFADGSIGTVHYFANGARSFPKERLEIFCGGTVLQLDNFRRLTAYGWPGFKRLNLFRQDKGNAACIAAFIRAINRSEVSPIPLDELGEVTSACFDAVESMQSAPQGCH